MSIMKQFAAAFAFTLLPLAATAQEHIEKAFSDFLKMKGVTYAESHSKDSDPETHVITGMMDSYTFKVDQWTPSVLDNIRKAIRQDSEAAYQENWVTDGENLRADVALRKIMFNAEDGINIGMNYPNYILICFVDKKQSDYRYAYAVEWNEQEGKGVLLKTYAPLLKKKTTKLQMFSIPELSSESFSLPDSFKWSYSYSTSNSSSWLSRFNIYKECYSEQTDEKVAFAFATKIYELCKDCSSLNEEERQMVTEQIEELKAQTKDKTALKLFNSALKNLKEKKDEK